MLAVCMAMTEALEVSDGGLLAPMMRLRDRRVNVVRRGPCAKAAAVEASRVGESGDP